MCFLETQPSAEQLRAKSGKTMPAYERRKGHSKYLQKQKQRAGEAGQLFAARGFLPDLQGKGHERKEAFQLT